MTSPDAPQAQAKRLKRKIRPYDLPEHPGFAAGHGALRDWSRAKSSALNQYVIGFGALAEDEWAAAGLAAPDLQRMRAYRIERIMAELNANDLGGVVLYDPLNVRYATDSTNMQLWVMHNPVRSAFVSAGGYVILFDYHHCQHLSDFSEVIDEVQAGTSWFHFSVGDRVHEKARTWAGRIGDIVREHCGGNRRIAFDQIDSHGIAPLQAEGIEVVYGEGVMEDARAIKSADEILAMRRAIHACEAAMHAMEAQLVPGMTENDLWAIMHAENVRRGGEWIETRLLSSGPRTNPWFQESSARVIEAGDIVAFDTDLVGPYGFCCDISRTWLAGDGPATNEQRHLYRMAADQIACNRELLAPGVSFRELSERARSLPEDYLPNRYSCLFHGVGLCDEHPSIPYQVDWAATGDNGVLKPGMVMCVESYVGRLGGDEGIKLEDQYLITETGSEQLSTYHLDARLGV